MIIPHEFIVASKSPIKVDTVRETIARIWPASEYQVTAIGAPSGVNEQPLGQETIDGALARLQYAREHLVGTARTYISIENGLFRISDDDPDLDPTFDPLASYEDRAVIALSPPDQTTPILFVSPRHEAIPFPDAAVRDTASLPGGFELHTVGETLFDVGLVGDKQDPHSDLTNGALSRHIQIKRALLRAIIRSRISF